MKAIRVLSLFDGISCGMVALERVGIPVEKYYASEIVPSAIKISSKNYPQIVQLGDITQIDEKTLDEIMPIDLVIGGSPCQDLSIYKFDRGEVTGLNGEKSGLFYHYMRILKYVKPKFFLLENVPMEEKWRIEISKLLEVEPILINSNLVCAADRKRLYWTNIPEITQPDDKGLILNDIVIPSQNVPEKYWYSKPFKYNGDDCKVQCNLELNGHRHMKEVYNLNGKCSTLTTCGGGNLQKKVYQDGRCRKLTPLEYERLQTLPDGYTDGVADTHRYNAIGNGWTVDVIAHIFKSLKQELSKDTQEKRIKLLSLFSGIGAFEKALTNLGVDYELVAYSEIDKYASKSYCAIHNVDETMNLGDITQIDEKKLPKDIDLTVYGFPCTDISLAGRQVGLFNIDGTRTRSGLFFDALRIIKETQPKVAIAENVKNLTGKKFKLQFELVLKSLEDAGYNNYWKVLNSKDFGIPQNRERVFIISVRKDVDNGQYEFPQGFPLKLRLKDMLDDIVDEKYYIKVEKVNQFLTNNPTLDFTKNALETCHERDVLSYETKDSKYNLENAEEFKLSGAYGRSFGSRGKLQELDGICDTLVAAMGTGGENVPIVTEPVRLGNIYGEQFGTGYAGNVWDKNAISPTLMTMQGGNRQPMVIVDEPTIQKIDIPQTVKIRTYDVDCKSLCNCLRNHKESLKLSNKEIANILNIPLTKVEHYFRKDEYFAIPDSEIWLKLKELLKIETDEFDKAIMTFEEKEGVYEKSERHYFTNGIAPTLTSSSAGNEKFIIEENTNEPSVINPLKDKSPYGWHFEQNVYDTSGITRAIKAGGGSGNIPKAIIYDEPKINVIGNYSPSNHDASRIVDENGIAPTVKENHGTVTATVHNFKIRKLTPKECFRLQGFDDRSFELAEKVNSNSQLYKQAGNSITVQVLEYVIKALFDYNLLN